jgi:hypothetical protein
MTAPNEIHDLNDLNEVIGELTTKFIPLDAFSINWLWFRGQPDASKHPFPGVEREDFLRRATSRMLPPVEAERTLNTEIQLNLEFQRFCARLLPTDCSLVETYFHAQHYGLPTRLLDWTTNPLAALFFSACKDTDKDGKIFITRSDQIGSRHLKLPQNELGPDVIATVNLLFGRTQNLPAEPGIVPISPTCRLTRMFNQNSCFTLHMVGAEVLPFKEGSDSSHGEASAYTVPQRFKPQIIEDLRRFNIHWASLFQDIDFAAKDLRARLGLPQ